VQAIRDLPLRYNPPVSYSQHGEDVFVFDNCLGARSGNGIYVDIGASHPARLSNTYYFYRKGWRGLIVEPINALLEQHRKWRPHDTHVQCLIGEEDSESTFYQLYPSVLSTTSADELEFRLQDGSILLREEVLPMLTLPTLLRQYIPDQKIDFMSVDVEGIDIILAKQIAQLDQQIRPGILCIEANSQEAEEQMRQILGEVYETVHVLGCNLIFW
jgi:hypothetical protein